MTTATNGSSLEGQRNALVAAGTANPKVAEALAAFRLASQFVPIPVAPQQQTRFSTSANA